MAIGRASRRFSEIARRLGRHRSAIDRELARHRCFDGCRPDSAEELGGLPAKARRTITHDGGGEFARHGAVTEAIRMNAYFIDPHSPWQRSSIENANGRLRRDLPR